MKTDTQIQHDVMAELKWKPLINAAEIGVEVKDGIVTLAGRVDSYAEKWQAERITQKVKGVKALTVNIEVNLLGSSVRDDVDIARSIKNVLDNITLLIPKDAINILVEKGWVTLSGELEWNYQKQEVLKSVRYLMGVTGVSDHIKIKPAVDFVTVKNEIELALKRIVGADSSHIAVEIRDNVVILSGYVRNLYDRYFAVQSAWCVPGVHNVVDNITLRIS